VLTLSGSLLEGAARELGGLLLPGRAPQPVPGWPWPARSKPGVGAGRASHPSRGAGWALLPAAAAGLLT
jgi:hypothetical protein